MGARPAASGRRLVLRSSAVDARGAGSSEAGPEVRPSATCLVATPIASARRDIRLSTTSERSASTAEGSSSIRLYTGASPPYNLERFERSVELNSYDLLVNPYETEESDRLATSNPYEMDSSPYRNPSWVVSDHYHRQRRASKLYGKLASLWGELARRWRRVNFVYRKLNSLYGELAHR